MLRRVYLKAISNWQFVLTQSVPDEESFKKAFRGTLGRHPELIECARSGGLLSSVLRQEFPTLARDSPESIDSLIQDVLAGFVQATTAEFEEFVREAGLEGKLGEVERLEAQLRASRAEAASERPLPVAVRPEQEMRSIAVEAMLAHEAVLVKELERVSGQPGSFCTALAHSLHSHAPSLSFTHTHTHTHTYTLTQLRADNSSLEAEVEDLSARSKAVGAASEQRLAQLHVAAEAARQCLDGKGGQ